MSVVLYFVLPQPSPIGFSFPLDATIGYLAVRRLLQCNIGVIHNSDRMDNCAESPKSSAFDDAANRKMPSSKIKKKG